MTKKSLFTAVVLAGLIGGTSLAQAGDPLVGKWTLNVAKSKGAKQDVDPVVGTWELNVTKSKYSPGPPPKSETRTYVVVGQDIKATLKGTDSEGKPYSGEWTMNYDGRDRPMKGNPDADTLSLKRTDASSAQFTLKRAGTVVITGTRTISRDGKTMTITAKGTNARGQTLDEVEVFEKR